MVRGALIVAVVALLAVAGIVEGIRTNRWGDSEDIRVAAAKLDNTPRTVGVWTSTESPIDDKVLRVARAAGHVSRVYTNGKTGDAVSLLLLCGPTGDIAAHTPNICYAAAGYTMQGPESGSKRTLAELGVTYWSARFDRPGPNESSLEVAWAWGTEGDWSAAENPRREFLLRGALYKLYVSRSVAPGAPTVERKTDPTRDFMMVFLPELKKILGPNPG